MPLNIVLDLSDEDLQYFGRVMESVWKKNSKKPERELVDGARKLIKAAHKAKAPEYIRKRLEDIALLIALLDDKEWSVDLSAQDRTRILGAISYFAIPKDMISDRVPGIGFLDDAVVADLVIRELKHDIKGYRDFVAYRENTEAGGAKANRKDWLATKRKQLFARIERHRERMKGNRDGLTHPILRFKS